MEIVKEKVEVERYVISADGTVSRYIQGVSQEQKEAYIREIREYEESAKGVLFARLQQRGVISELKRIKDTDGKGLSAEAKKFNSALTLLDGIMDDCYERSTYYLFTPAAEQDVKDLATYAKMQWGISLLSQTEDDEGYRLTYRPEVGKVYVFQINTDAEWMGLMSPVQFIKRATSMADILEDLGKKQFKELKK